jgi:5-methylcytosine-specific restriction endonuclease McrA
VGQVLVLDIAYQPVQQVHWHKAVEWIVKKKIEVIDEHPDRYINSANWTLKMPSIVRLIRPVSRRKAIKFSRHNVFTRDNGRCQYCSVRLTLKCFTYDHVLPRAQGGKTDWTNVVVSCIPCNQRKASRTPAQAGMHLSVMPVRPKSLPEAKNGFAFADGMPESWRDFLHSSAYWNVELEHDGE